MNCQLNVTNRYLCNYINLHKENPIYLQIKDNSFNHILVLPRNYPMSKYIIQVCILLDNNPLYIHRESVYNINNIDFFNFLKIKSYSLS